MFAVMACVLICKEVTSASATMALRLPRTRLCAWVRGRTLVPGVQGTETPRELMGRPLAVTNYHVSCQKQSRKKLAHAFIQCKICEQGHTTVYSLVHCFNLFAQMPFTRFSCTLGHSRFCGSHHSHQLPFPLLCSHSRKPVQPQECKGVVVVRAIVLK